jgi:Ca-activated chloride channel family protein
VEHVGDSHRAIDRIYEGGGTNLIAGMDRGAREVRTSIRDGAIGRVVVLSDGKANVGVTDPGALDRFAADLSSQGVALSAIGLGLDYNEDVLARLADVGGGTYDFVDDATELERVFADELERTASVVARGTRIHVAFPAGVDPVEVIGWDAVRSGDGWDVFVGDVYSGDTKKIVARVRVKGDALGEKSIAHVSADYTDLIDARAAVSVADAYASVTADAGVVDASVDKARAVEATRALGSWYLDLSTRAYEKGDRARSRELAVQGSALLRSQADSLGAADLAEEAADIEAASEVFEMHAPTSATGRTAIKKNKEIFRDASR